MEKVIDLGRICIKTAGREKGKLCVIISNPQGNKVLISGARKYYMCKRRLCNIKHLMPTRYKIDISENASDEEIEKKLREQGIIEKFGLRKVLKK